MSSFEETKWSAADYAADYLKKADAIIPQRPKLLGLLRSFYLHFFDDLSDNGQPRKIVELGSGDGAFTEELLKTGQNIEATLIDGSAEMLAQARLRLAPYEGLRFIDSSFQKLISNDAIPAGADLIFSVLAIHHISKEEKRELFELIYAQLAPGGFFINIDDCIPVSSLIEGWHVERWRKEVIEKGAELGIEIDPQTYIDKHHDPEHRENLETVAALCATLDAAGFIGAECFYRDGIFTVYGGQKSAAT